MKRTALFALLLASFGSRAWAIDCSTVSGNLIGNCGFESGVTGWTLVVGGGFQSSGGGQTGLGARFDGDQAGNSDLRSACVGSQPGSEYSVGIAATADGPASSATCTVGVQEFSDANCTAPLAYSPSSAPQLITSSGFTDFSGNHVSGPGVGSVQLALVCAQGVAGFEARVDNGFLAISPDVIAVPLSPAGLALFATVLAFAALAVLRLGR